MGQFYRNVVLKIIGENWNAKYVNNIYANQLPRLSKTIKVDSKV